MSHNRIEGEGSYTAARAYDEATEAFVKAGKVEGAARAAEPHDAQEAAELESAENEGLRHSKGEDPLLKKPEAADRDADRDADPDGALVASADGNARGGSEKATAE